MILNLLCIDVLPRNKNLSIELLFYNLLKMKICINWFPGKCYSQKLNNYLVIKFGLYIISEESKLVHNVWKRKIYKEFSFLTVLLS